MANPRKKAAEKIRYRQALMHVSTPGRRRPEGEVVQREEDFYTPSTIPETARNLVEGDLTPKGLKLFNTWLKEGIKKDVLSPEMASLPRRVSLFIEDHHGVRDLDYGKAYERGVKAGLIEPLLGIGEEKAKHRKKAAEGIRARGKITLPKGSQRYEAERKFEKIKKGE